MKQKGKPKGSTGSARIGFCVGFEGQGGGIRVTLTTAFPSDLTTRTKQLKLLRMTTNN